MLLPLRECPCSTLRNFPSDIVHWSAVLSSHHTRTLSLHVLLSLTRVCCVCRVWWLRGGSIEWAREKFDDLFVSGADLANSFLEDRVAFFAKLRQDALTEADALKSVSSWLQLAGRPTFELCVRVILDDFTANFRNAINDLTHNFPKDARNVEKDTGVDLGPFWHGHKRFPQAAAFDPNNAQHVDYIHHGVNILAAVFGLHEQDRDTVTRVVSGMTVQPWQYTGARVDLSGQEGEEKKAEEDKAPTSLADEDVQLIEQLTAQLQQIDTSAIKRMHPADFEKGARHSA